MGVGSWDRQAHTAAFKMDNRQGLPAERRELCSELRGSLGGRGTSGENGYTRGGPFTVHLRPSQPCSLAMPRTPQKVLK